MGEHAQLCSGIPAKTGHQPHCLLFPNRNAKLSFPLALLTPGMAKLRTGSHHLVAAGWRQELSSHWALLTPRKRREAEGQLALPATTSFCLIDARLG